MTLIDNEQAKPAAAVQIEPLVYRPEVAARVLAVSRTTIYRMIARGDLKSYKLGTATVIRRADLVKLVEGLEPTIDTAQS